MRKIVTMEMKNEVVAMTKAGNSVTQICEALDISKPTVSKIRRESGLTGLYGKGGTVAKTIPFSEIAKNSKKEIVEEEVPPVLINDQSIEICGTETMTRFKAELRKDSVTIEGELIVGEIKIDKIIDLANELKGVYNLVTKMKGNRFGLME